MGWPAPGVSLKVRAMKFPSLLEPMRQRLAAQLAPADQAERLLAETFRTLGVLCTRLADLVESQRLARAGYRDQGRFLERLDRPVPPPSDPGPTR